MPDRLYLYFRKGRDTKTRILLPDEGIMRMGRDASNCHVVIPDPRLSRTHCELAVSASKRLMRVKDTQSSNGIYVNKKRVTQAFMRPGDRLYLGGTILELVAHPLEPSSEYLTVTVSGDTSVPVEQLLAAGGTKKAVAAQAPSATPAAAAASAGASAPIAKEEVDLSPPSFEDDDVPPLGEQMDMSLLETYLDSPIASPGVRGAIAISDETRDLPSYVPDAEPEGSSDKEFEDMLRGMSELDLPEGGGRKIDPSMFGPTVEVGKTEELVSFKWLEPNTADPAAGAPPSIGSSVRIPPVALDDDPLIDRTVGGYTIEAVIATTEIGRTYRAKHRLMDQRFVLKVLDPQWMDEQEVVDRFVREAQVGSRLHHPNIMRIVNAGKDGDVVYHALEYVEGAPFDRLLEKRAPFVAVEVIRIGRHLCSALHYAHGLGVLHRNIAPENILFRESNNDIVIQNFGLARVLIGEDGVPVVSSAANVSVSPYQAPELMDGARATAASDLYGVGAVLYHALTGRPPFDPGTPGLVGAIMNQAPTPIRSIVPDAPAALVAVIEKALMRDPMTRYRDASEFGRDLERLSS